MAAAAAYSWSQDQYYVSEHDGRVTIFRGVDANLPGLTLQPSEIKQVRFCTLAEAAELVTPLSHRRLTVATALAPGQMAYLEDGTAPHVP